MSEVQIQRFKEEESLPQGLFEQMENLVSSIRQRAYSLFQLRGGWEGRDVDDWVQAEHELVWMPQSEFIENDREFRAKLAVPGFDPTELEVTATPNELIVQAKHEHKHDESEGNVQYCEFGEKRLFRRLNMPAKIDQDRVTASLDKGILQVVAKKAQAAKSVPATA